MSHTGIQLWPDDELLELMRQGDRSAFEKIYNKYWSKIYISAYNLLRDRQTCEDLVQEVLVNLWVRRENLEVKNLNAFLYTAIRYKVFKVIRSGKVREDLFNEIETLIIPDNDTENSIAENDFNRFLEDCIATLPPKCREIFILSRKEQLSTKEIAERLGISAKTVENQITIALRKLRYNMGEFLFWYIVLMPLLWR